jgi:hypothetical protein
MQSLLNNIIISNPNKYRKLTGKSATLYYLRLEFNNINSKSNDNGNFAGEIAGDSIIYNNNNKLILYKLGYTTQSLQERVHGTPNKYKRDKYGRLRLASTGHNGMGLPTGTDVYIISTYRHTNASLIYQYEQVLHSMYCADKWHGNPVMGNGNSELYIRDILDLDY